MNNNDTKRDGIIVFPLCSALILGMLCIFALFSSVIMRFLGFQYESVGKFLLYFIIAHIVSYPLNLIAEALPKVLFELDRVSKRGAVLLYVPLDTFATFSGFFIVDLFMPSVTASSLSLAVISFLFALLSVYLGLKKEK